MAINRSTQFFTLDGLTVFKENVIKNYAKLGTIDAYIDSVIYNAMMQYKRDIVKFVSNKKNLPMPGSPGTLYMVPKHIDNTRYKPNSNEIWVTSTGGFHTMRLYVYGTGKYVDMPKNEYGFFVLDLNKVDPSINERIAFFESTETSAGTAQSTTWMYMPNVTGASTINVSITSFAQLYTLGGSIVSVEKYNDPLMVRIPVPQSYVGNKSDIVLSKNTGEIWINAPYDGDYLVCQFSERYTVNAPRNVYGYYVLSIDNLVKRRIEYFAIYKPDSVNTINIRRMDTNAYLVTKYSDLLNLVGSVIAIALDSVSYSDRYAISLSNYEQEFSETYTIPDDEIWVSSESTSLFYNFAPNPERGYVTETNEYGYFVLKRGVHFPDDPTASLNAKPSLDDDNTTGSAYAYTKEDGIFIIGGKHAEFLHKLCGHIVVSPNTGTFERNVIISIYPQDTTTSNIATLVQTSGVTIPSDEIWIDSANWPTLCLRAYNSNKAFAVELNKNEYGYYVLRSEDYTEYANDSSYDLRFFTADIPITAHDQVNDSANAKYTTGISTMILRKWFNSNDCDYLYLQNIFSYIGGERVVLSVGTSSVSVIPEEFPIVTYTGANGDQFVTYAYENGKYITLGSTIFDVSHVTIDRILDGNSLHTVQNKVIYDALPYKYNTADIIDSVIENDNNLVTSRGIQAALAPKLGWDDLRNITLYQLMRELRFPWNMPTKMYFKLVVYAPIKEQDLAIFYPTLVQRLQFSTYGFVSTDNKFTYKDYDNPKTKYIDGNTNDEIWLQNQFDIPMYSSYDPVCLSRNVTYNLVANTNSDIQFTITSENPVNMNTLANLSYKFRAYSSEESSTHSHINKIYVSTYLSPDGVDWHTLQNKTIYKWDDNYEELNDYIYLIPILA